MELYENIRAACKEKRVSITKMEQDLDFPQSSICKWKKHEPRVGKVKAVAEYLGISVDRLVE